MPTTIHVPRAIRRAHKAYLNCTRKLNTLEHRIKILGRAQQTLVERAVGYENKAGHIYKTIRNINETLKELQNKKGAAVKLRYGFLKTILGLYKLLFKLFKTISAGYRKKIDMISRTSKAAKITYKRLQAAKEQQERLINQLNSLQSKLDTLWMRRDTVLIEPKSERSKAGLEGLKKGLNKQWKAIFDKINELSEESLRIDNQLQSLYKQTTAQILNGLKPDPKLKEQIRKAESIEAQIHQKLKMYEESLARINLRLEKLEKIDVYEDPWAELRKIRRR